MSRRRLYCSLLPMLALLLAIPCAHAEEDNSFCNGANGLPATRPHLQPLPADTSSSVAFSGSRVLTTPIASRKTQLALCRGTLHVLPSLDGTASVTIQLRKPLPAGRTVADFIDRFDTADGSLHLAIDLPEANGVTVTLTLPQAQETELVLGVGKAQLETVPGDLKIAIGKGDVSLRADSSAIGEIEVAAAVGGLHDTRPGGFGNHGHLLTAWNGKGPGRYKLNFAAGSGDLILLPPTQ